MKTTVEAYRFSAPKPIGRSRKKSAVASAAYISRSRLKDEETGKIHDYRNKGSKALFAKIYTPDKVPEWAHNAQQLWNNVQRRENRKNSQFARSIQFSLPHGLSHQQMEALVNDYAKNFTNEGMIAHIAVHIPEPDSDQRNYHAHLLLTLRRLDENGFVGNKVREWNERSLFQTWRENLALECSKQLAIAKQTQTAQRWKYAHLTLPEQRNQAILRGDLDYADACNKVPSAHKGVQIHHIQKRNIDSYLEQHREEQRLLKNGVDDDFLAKFSYLLPKDVKVGDYLDPTKRKHIEDASKYVDDLLLENELDRDRERERIRQR